MTRRGWISLGAIALVGAIGLGVWAWFLAGRSLDVMDQWSSVLSSFGTLAALVVAVLSLVVAFNGPAASKGARSVRIGGDAPHARITQGDHSPVRAKDP